MKSSAHLPPIVERLVARRQQLLWLNDHWQPFESAKSRLPLKWDDVLDAEVNWNRFARLLKKLFPELESSGGIIESQLHPADHLQKALLPNSSRPGRWFIKGDHALPVAGSVKARGGIYEILIHAQSLALRLGLMKPQDDPSILASSEVRQCFAKYTVAVGSTGNLGLSIGVIAAALGFRATVHMSSDAKQWKKERLRVRGVEVVEHQGDFGAAVAAGREQARHNASTYFVDDENSKQLFLGYSVAAIRLKQQLLDQGIKVDAHHPLFVYLPCGVGGAPGGITFGLRHLFDDHVHCFFAEPLASPCMLLRLALKEDTAISVTDVGLDNRTEADGLAVGQASDFAAPLMRPLVSGIFTVPDADLFEDLYLLEQSEGLLIEPSAAAGFRGPKWVLESDAGRQYLAQHNLSTRMADATHILWTTGGAFVPEEEFWSFHQRGRIAWTKKEC